MDINHLEYRNCQCVELHKEEPSYFNHYRLKILDENLHTHFIFINSSKLKQYLEELKEGKMKEILLCYGKIDVDIKIENEQLLILENKNDMNIKEFYFNIEILDSLIEELSKY